MAKRNKEDLEEMEEEGHSFLETTLLGFKEGFKWLFKFVNRMKVASDERYKRDIETRNRQRGETLKSRGQELHFLKQEKLLLKEEKEISDLKEELGENGTGSQGYRKRDIMKGGLGGPF